MGRQAGLPGAHLLAWHILPGAASVGPVMFSDHFRIAHSFRVPGLGLLVQPAAPAPAWLLAPPLHTAVQVRLHRPGHEALLLPATVEEIARATELPARALLLDADPGELPPGATLELVAVATNLLL